MRKADDDEKGQFCFARKQLDSAAPGPRKTPQGGFDQNTKYAGAQLLHSPWGMAAAAAGEKKVTRHPGGGRLGPPLRATISDR